MLGMESLSPRYYQVCNEVVVVVAVVVIHCQLQRLISIKMNLL